MNQYIVRNSVLLDATPAAVWDALTNPEQTKKYFFNCEVISKWKPGSSITFKGRMFIFLKVEMHGVIEEIKPEQFLKYKLNNDADGTFSLVTDTLTEENGKTLLTISDNVGQGGNAQKRYKRSVKGWEKILKGLKKVVEPAT